jgi:CheY-like chemotaxis protein
MSQNATLCRGLEREPVAAVAGSGRGTVAALDGPVIVQAPRRFRILVAEDDTEMRRVIADTLRDDGYDVVELADGGRLLVDVAARLKGEPEADSIDLIVSDIRMPICTGLEIVEALRHAHWRTPVILMTAFGDDATRRKAEGLRAVLFDKPFDLDDLRTAVKNMLLSDGCRLQ